MAFTGTGPVWSHSPGDFVAVNWPGTQAGYDAAVAAVTGIVFLGPGPADTVTLGVLGANVALLRVTSTGLYAVSKFAIADGTDPTKLFVIDASGIATATTRTAQAPNYSGLLVLPATLGNAGEFLRSGGAGVQPTWASVPSPTNALLDGVNHTDTVAQAVTRGSLIVGNSTPKWDELVIGAANTVLMSNGTDVAWSLNPALQHDALAHLKPFAVADGKWDNATNTITQDPAAGGFANVKVGDFVYLGTSTTNTRQGARVSVWNNSNSITVDRTQTDGNFTGTIVFMPGDHWNDTVALHVGTGAGYLVSTGRGTYNVGNTSGTFQEWNGPVRWGTFNNTIVSDFRVAGYSGGSVGGFGIFDASNLTRVAYFNVGSLTGPCNFTLPPTGGRVMTDASTENGITGTKHFTGPTILDSDGTTNRTVFQNAGGNNFLGFASSGNTLRVATWPDLAGNVVLRNAQGNHTGQTGAIGSTTLATAPPVGMYRISGFMNCTVAGGSNAVLQLDWTDDTARTAQTVCTLDKAATNYAQGSLVIYVGSGNVSYNVTYAGTGTYTARIRMEAL